MAELIRIFGAQHHCQIETVPFLTGEAFLSAFEEGSFFAIFMDIYAACRQLVHPCIPDLKHRLYAGCLLLPRI